MTSLLARFARDEGGATAIEYGLIAALLGVALVTALTGVGGALKNQFNAVSGAISSH